MQRLGSGGSRPTDSNAMGLLDDDNALFLRQDVNLTERHHDELIDVVGLGLCEAAARL